MATPFERLLDAAHDDVRVAFPQIKDPTHAVSVTRDNRSGWLVRVDVPPLPAFDWQGSAYDAEDARFRAWAAFIRKHCKRVPTWAKLAGLGTTIPGDMIVFAGTKKTPRRPWIAWDSLAVVGIVVLAFVVIIGLVWAGVSELNQLAELLPSRR